MMAEPAPKRYPTIQVRFFLTAPIAAITSVMLCVQREAYRGSSRRACRAATNRKRCGSSKNGTNRSIGCGAGSRRSSGRGSSATAYAECDGEVSPKPPSKSTSPPSPTTSRRHEHSRMQKHENRPPFRPGRGDIGQSPPQNKKQYFSVPYNNPRTGLLARAHSLPKWHGHHAGALLSFARNDALPPRSRQLAKPD